MKIMKTSETHPLQIASVEAGSGRGRIGITFAPGKQDPDAWTGSWKRDLATDLDVIAASKAKILVTLLEDREMEDLHIAELGTEVRRRNIQWLHLPIRDVSAPSDHFEAEWPAQSDRLRSMLISGETIVIHCKGGLGRAGMISARLLVELGDDPEVAIAKVRAARGPRAIETKAQENWVKVGPTHTRFGSIRRGPQGR